MKVFVLNGWAAGPETWELCTFARDAAFDYIEQMDGRAEEALAASEGAVLVGFSMGGAMALKLLLAHPDKVRGLVLISTTPCMSEKKDEAWAGMSARRREALHFGTRITYAGNPSPLYDDANLVRGLDFLRDSDTRAELTALAAADRRVATLPVAIFQSERDGIVRPHNAAFLKSVFRDATVTMVPGGEHTLPVTEPERISAAVVRVCNAAGPSRLVRTLRAWPVIALATIVLCFLTKTVAAWCGIDLPDQSNVALVRQWGLHAFDSWRNFGVFAFLVAQILIIMPVLEELFFRGLLFKLPVSRLRFRSRVAVCAVLSSALFAAAHYLAQPWPDAAFLALFFFGLAQCWLYGKTARLWCTMLNHALFNLTNFVLLFVVPE